MVIANKYSNAFSEVYEILSYLDKEDYKKIPKDFLKVIEENRNLNYEYKLKEDLELREQEILPETKAILLNIFRDYLSTPEQSKKIKKWQAEDIKKLEKQKCEKYDIDIFKNEKEKNTIFFPNENLAVIEKKENIIKKILNKIIKFFQKK